VDDVAAMARQLKLEKVDVMGYSFGGGIALPTAIRHPDLVDRLVVISAPMKRSGMYPEVVAAFEQMAKNASAIASNIKASPLAKTYPETNWEASFRKMGELGSRDYDWTEPVKAIKAPTLLIFADADSVRLEHIVEFYKVLGGASVMPVSTALADQWRNWRLCPAPPTTTSSATPPSPPSSKRFWARTGPSSDYSPSY
jgi:pimeloyl-ACP methyl ester carboxylesterase